MSDQVNESPNIHSSAVPIAQMVGLLDVVDPMKFSEQALGNPPSYVRNFAHAVAGHEARVMQDAQEAATFKSANEVWSAVTELLNKVEASGFEVDVFEDAGQKHCVRVIMAGQKRLVVASSTTGQTNRPANPA